MEPRTGSDRLVTERGRAQQGHNPARQQQQRWERFCPAPPGGMAHHLSRMAPHIVSPTPIRPHSPASSPSRGERGNTPPQKTGYLDAEAPLADEQEAGEMCAELMEIFSTGSPRCAPPGPGGSGGQACLDSLKPPSRNQNPLPKDQHFSKGTSARQGDDFAVKLSAALCGEILRNTSCLSPPLPSPTADSFKA